MIIWDDSLSSYVFYGRSHRGNPHRDPSDCCTGTNCWPPARTVARSVIGPDLHSWGCANATMPVCNTRDMQTIFTADAADPPCMDIVSPSFTTLTLHSPCSS